MSRFAAIAAVALGLLLAEGCAALTPEDPDLINDRLRPGPGLLSGASGEFVVLQGKPDPARPQSD